MLAALVAATTGVPAAGAATPAVVGATGATGATGTLTLKDPNTPGLMLEVTPGDPTAYRQGDIVHLHFSGIPAGGSSVPSGPARPPVPAVSLKEGDSSLPTISSSPRPALQPVQQAPPDQPAGQHRPDRRREPRTVVRPLRRVSRSDGTIDVDFRVGAGDQVEPDAPIGYLNDYSQVTPAPPTLTCDETHPCVIGFSVRLPPCPRGSSTTGRTSRR